MPNTAIIAGANAQQQSSWVAIMLGIAAQPTGIQHERFTTALEL